jgi:hypothetical protein
MCAGCAADIVVAAVTTYTGIRVYLGQHPDAFKAILLTAHADAAEAAAAACLWHTNAIDFATGACN